jgi:magnesium transporter
MRIETMTDNTILLPLVQKLIEHDLRAAAHILESMPESEAAAALKSLPIPLAIRVAKALQINYAAELLKDADDQFLNELTQQLDPQFLASMLMRLPVEARERMSQHISRKLRGQIRELLDYLEGSIGRTMTTDFVALKRAIRPRRPLKKSAHWPKSSIRHPMSTLSMRKIASSVY